MNLRAPFSRISLTQPQISLLRSFSLASRRNGGFKLPRSSNPTILRLLDAEPLYLSLQKSLSVYPRRRLVFGEQGQEFHEIYKLDPKALTGYDSSLSMYTFYCYLPSLIYLLTIALRLDLYSPLHWGGFSVSALAGYYGTTLIRREKQKWIKHLLTSEDYKDLIFGIDNLDKTGDTSCLPEYVTPIPGLTYKKVQLQQVVFFGYKLTYDLVKKGKSVEDATILAQQKLDDANGFAPALFAAMTQKKKLLLIVVIYDKEENQYVELEINPNFNSIPELTDYLDCLRNKTKMRFFKN